MAAFFCCGLFTRMLRCSEIAADVELFKFNKTNLKITARVFPALSG